MAQPPSQAPQTARRAANIGLTRPPYVYLLAILIGVALHFIWPLPFVPNLARLLGVPIVVFAATLFIWAVRTFRSAGTPVPGNRPTTTIVNVGPYRFTRNPIYLAFSSFQTGIAFAVNDAWILLTLLLAIAVITFVVIPREERYLEANFGEQYQSYRASVRRWI